MWVHPILELRRPEMLTQTRRASKPCAAAIPSSVSLDHRGVAEAVALAPDGLQVAGLVGVVLYLVANLAHEHGDARRLGPIGLAPHVGHDVLGREHLPPHDWRETR